MRLRVEKTIRTFYTCVLDECDSARVVENAERKGLTYEESLQDLVDNDPDFFTPWMDEIDEDEYYNYVDEEYEDSVLPKGGNNNA